jgi:hypothetical protein
LDLRSIGCTRATAHGRPRSRTRKLAEPGRDYRALPSDHRRIFGSDRVCRRPRTQAVAAAPRRRPPRKLQRTSTDCHRLTRGLAAPRRRKNSPGEADPTLLNPIVTTLGSILRSSVLVFLTILGTILIAIHNFALHPRVSRLSGD